MTAKPNFAVIIVPIVLLVGAVAFVFVNDMTLGGSDESVDSTTTTIFQTTTTTTIPLPTYSDCMVFQPGVKLVFTTGMPYMCGQKDTEGNNGPIASAQRVLVSLGCYDYPAPASNTFGQFGPRTFRAVLNFQRENGLNPTGAIDIETWNKLQLSTVLPC